MSDDYVARRRPLLCRDSEAEARLGVPGGRTRAGGFAVVRTRFACAGMLVDDVR
jgi:hypothetical protein